MSRRAFTLVELLAAAALSAALMTVGVGVLRSIGQPVAASAAEPWRLPLATILRADMAHALAVQVDGEVITLAGLNALDPSTAAPLHRPATVSYRVVTIGGVRWLVREQVPLDRASTSSIDLMGANVVRLRAVLPPIAPTRSRSDDDAPLPLADDASLPMVFRRLPGFRRAPERWQIVVEFEKQPPLTIAEAS